MPSKNLHCHHNNLHLIRHNTSLAKKLYPNINRARIKALKELTKQFSFSFASGDVIQLENGWFVTHTGLVRLARRKRCRGIHVESVDSLCDSSASRFVLKATVYPSKDSAGFVGYGDADPSNVSLLGPRRRDADGRDACGQPSASQGIWHRNLLGRGDWIQSWSDVAGSGCPEVSAEECQWKRQRFRSQGSRPAVPDHSPASSSIRELVKAYAVDFCGTKALKDATREQVESFVQQLAAAAAKDRSGLLCHLNSYARPNPEVVA